MIRTLLFIGVLALIAVLWREEEAALALGSPQPNMGGPKYRMSGLPWLLSHRFKGA